jgi:hypothetical protein
MRARKQSKSRYAPKHHTYKHRFLTPLKAAATHRLDKKRAFAYNPSFARSAEELDPLHWQPIQILEPRPEPYSSTASTARSSVTSVCLRDQAVPIASRNEGPETLEGDTQPPSSATNMFKDSLRHKLQAAMRRSRGTPEPSEETEATVVPRAPAPSEVEVLPAEESDSSTPMESAQESISSATMESAQESMEYPGFDNDGYATYDVPVQPLVDVRNGSDSVPPAICKRCQLPMLRKLNVSTATYDGPASPAPETVFSCEKGNGNSSKRPSQASTARHLSVQQGESSRKSSGCRVTSISAGSGMSADVPKTGQIRIETTRTTTSDSASAPTSPVSPMQIGVPIDATGRQTPPPLPPRNTTDIVRIKKGVNRFIRRARKDVLRKTILKVALGRELAGPTRQALIAAAKGDTVVCAVTTAASPSFGPTQTIASQGAMRSTAVTVTTSSVSVPESPPFTEMPAAMAPVVFATPAVPITAPLVTVPAPAMSFVPQAVPVAPGTSMTVTTAAIPATDGTVSVTIQHKDGRTDTFRTRPGRGA